MSDAKETTPVNEDAKTIAEDRELTADELANVSGAGGATDYLLAQAGKQGESSGAKKPKVID